MGNEVSQEKQAELNKEAEERLQAFAFGFDLSFADLGIDKQAFAEISGIPETQLLEYGLACLEMKMAGGQ